jgi:aminoglycoside phosphotransferase (APT) family kinase protein
MDWCPQNWIKNEEQLSRVIHESGLPVPAVEGIIDVEGRTGIIYERVDGVSLLDEMESNYNRSLRNAEILAELHASIHSRAIPGIPSLHDTIASDIRRVKVLTEGDRTKVLHDLNQLKDGTALCHYDYHPGNIIMSPRGPVIIDWMTARHGNPHADVARTLLILRYYLYFIPTDQHVAFNSFIDRYLARYVKLQNSSLKEVEAWRVPIAAARLNENLPREREWLLSIVKKELDCT